MHVNHINKFAIEIQILEDFKKNVSQGQMLHVNGTEFFKRNECFKYFKEYPGKLMPYNLWCIDEAQLIYVRAVESIHYNSSTVKNIL